MDDQGPPHSTDPLEETTREQEPQQEDRATSKIQLLQDTIRGFALPISSLVISYITTGNTAIYFERMGNHYLWDGFARELQYISKNHRLTLLPARPRHWNGHEVVVHANCRAYTVMKGYSLKENGLLANRLPVTKNYSSFLTSPVATTIFFSGIHIDLQLFAYCVVGDVLYVQTFANFFKRNLSDAPGVSITFLEAPKTNRRYCQLFPMDDNLVSFGPECTTGQPNPNAVIEYFSLRTETWSSATFDGTLVDRLSPLLVYL